MLERTIDQGTNSYNFWTNGGTIWRVVLLRTGWEGRYDLVKAWLSDVDAIAIEWVEREKEVMVGVGGGGGDANVYIHIAVQHRYSNNTTAIALALPDALTSEHASHPSKSTSTLQKTAPKAVSTTSTAMSTLFRGTIDVQTRQLEPRAPLAFPNYPPQRQHARVYL